MTALLALAACTGFADVDTDALRAITWSTTSDEGQAVVELEVRDGDTSFLLNVRGDDVVSVDYVLDPAGDVVLDWQDWDGARSLTGAFFPCDGSGCAYDFAFAWPIRPEDGELYAGTWQIVVDTTDEDYRWVDGSAVEATTLVKRDPDLDASAVAVRVVYASGVEDAPGVAAAVEAAVEHWRAIWAPYGLTLEVRYDRVDVSASLEFPSSEDAQLAEASAGSDDGELTLLIGEDIGGGVDWLGFAGGIPGALVPGPQSGVVVGWLAGAGPDGSFDADEIRLLAGTMAHEVGHFQGLFHPVESAYDAWDALADTPECDRRKRCEEELGDNLMFPYTIYDVGPQEALTSEQVAVIARYVGSR